MQEIRPVSDTGAFRWVLLLPVAGLLAGIGLAPIAATLIRDLFPALPWTIAGSVCAIGGSTAIGVLAAISIRYELLYKKTPDEVFRRLGRDFVASVVLVSLAAGFIAWESDNLFAWRMAKWVEPGVDVVKSTSVLRGVHIIRLERRSDSPAYGGVRSVAQAEIPTQLRLSGGEIRMAVRVGGAGEQINDNCDDDGASAVDIRQQMLPFSKVATILLSATCSHWVEKDISFVSGTEALELFVGSWTHKKIDLVFLGTSDDLFFLRTMINTLCFAILVVLGIRIFPNTGRNLSSPEGSPWKLAESVKTYGPTVAASVFAFIIIANFFVYSFVSSERTIYTWDFGGHWMSAVNASRSLTGGLDSARTGTSTVADDLSGDPESADPAVSMFDPSFMASLVRNIRYSEYNVSPAIPLAIPMALTGPTRMSYELSLVNIYTLSALVVVMLLLYQLLKRRSGPIPAVWPFVPAVVILCFSPFWVPIVRGYIGVCVVAVNVLILWLYLRQSIRQQTFLSLVLIGILLAGSVILRRWNGIWVVAFFAMLAVDALIYFIRSGELSLHNGLIAFRPILIAGTSAVGVLAALAWPLVITMSTTDYSDIYSAYGGAGSGVLAEFAHFVRTFGVGFIAFFVIAGGYLCFSKEHRRVAILLTLQVAVAAIYFTNIQEMGPHHMYVLMPAVFTLLGLAAIDFWRKAAGRSRLIAGALCVLFVANGIASNYAVFAPSGDPLRARLAPLVPENRRVPLVRHDIDEIARLAAYLDSQIVKSPIGRGIYVLSSSDVFNVAHLGMLEDSTGLTFDSKDYLLRTAAVDKRDGFPRQLLEAAIVVLGWPPQFNVPPENQNVVSIPAAMMMNSESIGDAFERLPEMFKLDSGVEVHVFRRVRENYSSEVDQLSEKLQRIHPDRPNIYVP